MKNIAAIRNLLCVPTPTNKLRIMKLCTSPEEIEYVSEKLPGFRQWQERQEKIQLAASDHKRAWLSLPSRGLTGFDERRFQQSVFHLKDLSGAALKSMILRRAHLSFAELEAAEIVDVDLQSANLSQAKMSGIKMQGTEKKKLSLYMAKMKEVDLSDSELEHVDFSSCFLQGSSFDNASLKHCCLSHMMHLVSAENAEFHHCRFPERAAGGADFTGAHFVGCHIGAFGESNLTGAVFDDCRIHTKSFYMCDLRGADMSGLHVERLEKKKLLFDRCQYDDNTVWPLSNKSYPAYELRHCERV